MSNPQAIGPDPVRSRLRATMALIEREIGALPKEGAADDSKTSLRAAFADLTQQLALGPEPELRACPVCKQLGMRAATTCGSCWAKLTAPPDSAATA